MRLITHLKVNTLIIISIKLEITYLMEIPFNKYENKESKKKISFQKITPHLAPKKIDRKEDDNLNKKNDTKDLIFEEKVSLQNSTSSNLNCYILNNEITKTFPYPYQFGNPESLTNEKKSLLNPCIKLENILNKINFNSNIIKGKLFGNALNEKKVELVFEYKKILSGETEEICKNDSSSILKFILKMRRTTKLEIKNGIGVLDIYFSLSLDKLNCKKASYKNRGRDICDCLVLISKWIFHKKCMKKKKGQLSSIKNPHFKIGNVSKKTIEYYYMFIKKGIKLRYNFEQNMKNKFSCLKNWVNKKLGKTNTKDFNLKYKMSKGEIQTKINNLISQLK